MSVTPEVPTSQLYCSECGRQFPAEELARFGANAVCAECKPRFVQRMQEGSFAHLQVRHGGFWRRFFAVLIDGIITAIVTFPIQMLLGVFFRHDGVDTLMNPTAGLELVGGIYLVSVIVNVLYYTYFFSQKGATPGKMLLGLRVVTAAGGPLSVGRAAGRVFAQILSGLTLLIGYIIAAFDSEKRALHDHICSTRVIRSA